MRRLVAVKSFGMAQVFPARPARTTISKMCIRRDFTTQWIGRPVGVSRLASPKMMIVVVGIGCGSATVGVSKIVCLPAEAVTEPDAASDSMLSADEHASPEDMAWKRRSRALRAAWREALRHWFSMIVLTLATFTSTAIERLALAGQVQQLMQLPGQMPVENVALQLAMILGVKSVHLLAEALRHIIANRLGQCLEGEAREHLEPKADLHSDKEALVDRLVDGDTASTLEAATATRLLLVEAAPKMVVEVAYAAVGAIGAVTTSPPLAIYFIAHEALVGQVVGVGAALLARRRDVKAEAARQRPMDNAAKIAANDAAVILDRYMETGQLLGLSSFVLTASAIIDKGFVSAEKYQRIMMLASNAMQSASEIAQAADKFQRGSLLLESVHDFDDRTGRSHFALPAAP